MASVTAESRPPLTRTIAGDIADYFAPPLASVEKIA
jgi:hypothetical protein